MTAPPPDESRRNPWTHVLVAGCAVFIFTVFLMVAAVFNRRAAGLTRFFDQHGMLVLGIEVGVILGLAVVVMAVERREMQRRIEERERALFAEATDTRATDTRGTDTRATNTRGTDESDSKEIESP